MHIFYKGEVSCLRKAICMHGQKDLMYGSNKILSNPSEVGRLHFILTFIVFKNQQYTYGTRVMQFKQWYWKNKSWWRKKKKEKKMVELFFIFIKGMPWLNHAHNKLELACSKETNGSWTFWSPLLTSTK